MQHHTHRYHHNEIPEVENFPLEVRSIPATQVVGSLSRSYQKVANEIKAFAHMARHLGKHQELVKMAI